MKLVATALLAAATLAGARPALEKPNIVMLFVDDLGYGDLGFNGHPTTKTPNIDKLAYSGKVLSSWYSGCPVCSGSRAALMTGRQFNRIGVPGVFGPTVDNGLPLNETTVADQLKKAGYATAIMGKWHLGQRPMYLPAARGFDEYLGIPYSDDMGEARRTPCAGQANQGHTIIEPSTYVYTEEDSVHGDDIQNLYNLNAFVGAKVKPLLPLVHQTGGVSSDPMGKSWAANTTILEQPLDFSTLAQKYATFVTEFIQKQGDKPFFLYMPFSHVHTTASNQPQKQYASCQFQNTSIRGAFGDALAEVDWIVGEVVDMLSSSGVSQNTLTLFTGDNGPWMIQGLSGGSEGLLTGRYSRYWNTGKGSTWEGGMHEAGFANWPGTIPPYSRSAEVVSSMDLFPTASALAGLELPKDRVYDGKDMSDVLLKEEGKSKHEVLFMYGGAAPVDGGPGAARMGPWKAYWATGPGLGGCDWPTCNKTMYPIENPLLFNIHIDPSEGLPLLGQLPSDNDHQPGQPTGPSDGWPVPMAEAEEAQKKLVAAWKVEKATFTKGSLISPPLLPGEACDGCSVAICCDQDPFMPSKKQPTCDCNGKPFVNPGGDVPGHGF